MEHLRRAQRAMKSLEAQLEAAQATAPAEGGSAGALSRAKASMRALEAEVTRATQALLLRNSGSNTAATTDAGWTDVSKPGTNVEDSTHGVLSASTSSIAASEVTAPPNTAAPPASATPAAEQASPTAADAGPTTTAPATPAAASVAPLTSGGSTSALSALPPNVPALRSSLPVEPLTATVFTSAPLPVPVGELDLTVKTSPGGRMAVPLRLRKNIRDEWEYKQEELNERLSELLQAAWTCHAEWKDVLSYATDPWVKDNPGTMLNDYFTAALNNLDSFLQVHGQEARDSINAYAPHHHLTLEPNTLVRVNGCDFHDGKLRITFHPSQLGISTEETLLTLRDAIDAAASRAPSTPDALPFTTRADIRENWDTRIPEILTRAQVLLNAPLLRFEPEFESVYAAIAAWEVKHPATTQSRREWTKHLGEWAREYYIAFLKTLEKQHFDSDEMMRQGWREAITEGIVRLRIVPPSTMSSATRPCEMAREGGTAFLQTTAQAWGWDFHRVGDNLLNVL